MGLLNNYADIDAEEEAARLRALVTFLNEDDDETEEDEDETEN